MLFYLISFIIFKYYFCLKFNSHNYSTINLWQLFALILFDLIHSNTVISGRYYLFFFFSRCRSFVSNTRLTYKTWIIILYCVYICVCDITLSRLVMEKKKLQHLFHVRKHYGIWCKETLLEANSMLRLK